MGCDNLWSDIGILCGKFKITTGAGNHLTPRTSDYESTTPKTGGAHPISWQVGKVWTPGAGYRDNYGNYYDYKGIPIVTPVDTKRYLELGDSLSAETEDYLEERLR